MVVGGKVPHPQPPHHPHPRPPPPLLLLPRRGWPRHPPARPRALRPHLPRPPHQAVPQPPLQLPLPQARCPLHRRQPSPLVGSRSSRWWLSRWSTSSPGEERDRQTDRPSQTVDMSNVLAHIVNIETSCLYAAHTCFSVPPKHFTNSFPPFHISSPPLILLKFSCSLLHLTTSR